MDAGTIAKERLEKYLNETLKDEFPEAAYEFYTYLLDAAKRHDINRSGYCSPAQQKDAAEAKRRTEAERKTTDTFHLPPRRSGGRKM